MTAGREWLIDKSAIARLTTSLDAPEWAARIERGLVRITTATLLAVGFSARSATTWDALVLRPPVSAMPIEYMVPRGEGRAVEVQGILARQGHHRAQSVPDLLIAATAELAELVVLHANKDFDLIASVTAQPVERLSIS